MDAALSGGARSSRHPPLAALTLAAIGVVYGDIGTSPLYTLKEIFAPAGGLGLTPRHLIGAVSCIVWALMIVVTLKYVLIVLRADNRGEGGVLALTAKVTHALGPQSRARGPLLALGVFAATLFYGDSVITPAISVLGAVEGLEVATPAFKPWILPISVGVLSALFLVQRHGTAVVGRAFGPIILLWFLTLAATGVFQIAQTPGILAALDPREAWRFLVERGWGVGVTVGAIVLAVTGAEALYADMGHFGRRPVQLAWNGLVLPSLALNYLGQGALLMRDASALENPFFHLFPDAWIWPALVLATLAAIIASQAVISGAYSMTRQAIQLGFLPRMQVRHTSAREAGQIYLPAVNVALWLGVLAVVLAFRSSGALAGAYGLAVTLTMLITTVLAYVVVRRAWRLPRVVALPGFGLFLALDLLLAGGCAVKLFDGGWLPLGLGALLFLVMRTWWRGRALALAAIRQEGVALQSFIDGLDGVERLRPGRVAVYAVADPLTVPQALLHNLKHNQVLHERNVVLTVRFHDLPWVGMDQRAQVEPLGRGFWRVTLNFGFMNTPDVPRALQLCAAQGLALEPACTSYFLSRETIVPTRGAGMAPWRERLFAAMSRNAGSVVDFFRLPDNAVVELGTRVQI